MSRNKQHVLVYNTANEQAANQLIGEFSSMGFSIQKKGIGETGQQSLASEVVWPDGAILLLVTDNFLRSSACMYGAFDALKDWAGSEKLVPIVADGRKPGPDGAWEDVPTSFDRVSTIIQYMNFWQDRYLGLRKEVRGHEDDEKLTHEIERVKSISSEAGEFLRTLRSMNWCNLTDFLEGAYRRYPAFSDGEEPMDILDLNTEIPEQLQPATPTPKTLAELIQDSSAELMAENADLSNEFYDDEWKPVEPLKDEHKSEEDAYTPGYLSLTTLPEDADSKMEPIHAVEQEDDVNAIINEVLSEEDDIVEEPYRFLGDDPDDPDNFDLDTLFEDESNDFDETENALESSLEDDEVLLDLVSDDEEGLVLKADGVGRATPEEVLEHAIALFDEGFIDDGLDYLKKTVKRNPGDLVLRYYYAFALARYGEQWNKARKQLNLILDHDNMHPDAWFLLAEVAEQQGNYAEAKQHFLKVASLQPDYPDVYYRLGLLNIQYFPDQDAIAAGYFKKAISHNQENHEACYLLGTLLNEKLEDPESAITYFTWTLELEPSHPFANYDLALLYHRLGDKDLAHSYYEKAIQLNPELKTPQNDAAFLHEKTKQVLVEAEQFGDAGQPVLSVSDEMTEDQAAPAESSVADLPEVKSNGQAAEAMIEPLTEAFNTNDLHEMAGAVSALLGIIDEMSFQPKEEPTVEWELPTQAAQAVEAALPMPEKASELPIVLITGATAGIGRATSEIFAANGYRVIATGRRAERLLELQNHFREQYNNEIQVLPFDVREPEAMRNAFDHLPESWRNVDILINNAGLSRGLAPIHEGDLEHWETMIDTNIKGLLYMTRAIAPQMVERRSGHIINVASSAGKEVYPGGNVYCATKAAVDTLTKAMRLDLFRHNVRVSQVAPGHVEETEFASVRFDGDVEKATKVYENFQPLKSSDVAEVIFFVATRPPHVNIQDVLMFGTQQAGSNFIERSGR